MGHLNGNVLLFTSDAETVTQLCIKIGDALVQEGQLKKGFTVGRSITTASFSGAPLLSRVLGNVIKTKHVKSHNNDSFEQTNSYENGLTSLIECKSTVK